MEIIFLSSRRRHTSWPRDWSSDVCSSDLADRLSIPYVWFPSDDGSHEVKDIRSGDQQPADPATWTPPAQDLQVTVRQRSEERRVGKECRARSAQVDCKQRGLRSERVRDPR